MNGSLSYVSLAKLSRRTIQGSTLDSSRLVAGMESQKRRAIRFTDERRQPFPEVTKAGVRIAARNSPNPGDPVEGMADAV